MENLLGIHGQKKTKKEFGKVPIDSGTTRTVKRFSERTETRRIIRNEKRFLKENLAEGVIYVFISVLFLMIFMISLKKFRKIIQRNDFIDHYVNSRCDFSNSSL